MMRALKPLAQLSSIVRMASTPNPTSLPSVKSGAEAGAMEDDDESDGHAK